LAAVLLIVLITVSLFFTVNTLSKHTSTRPFYVGVEFAYSNQFSQLKALVDQVKNYTNLFIIGSVGLTFNRTALDESCDYIFNSGLNFIVLFTSFLMYNDSNGWIGYTIFNWTADAEQKYGDQFLGIYRFDEPGGNQLDKGTSILINNNSTFSYPDDPTGYAAVSEGYVGNLSAIVEYYFNHTNYTTKIFTADYGLYWFDYASGYSTVLAEFVGNQSRQLIIALDRGAAQSFNKDWGVIIDWKYDQPPYLESGPELYSDLSLAYSAGATYAVVFSYPDIGPYGTLTQPQFDALQKFWNDIHTNPGLFAPSKAEEAYVIPEDYGFGFRGPSDTIWGLFSADSLSPKIWDDSEILLYGIVVSYQLPPQYRYYSNLNIIYDNSTLIGPTLNNYTKVFYWNQTVS
jgi:hypothetical protein